MGNRALLSAACTALFLISGCNVMHRRLECIATETDDAKSYEGKRFELIIHSPSKEFGGELGQGKLNYKDTPNVAPLSVDARMTVDLFSPEGLMPGMGEPGDEGYIVYSEIDPFGMQLVCKEK